MTIDRNRLKRVIGPVALALVVLLALVVIASLARVQERSAEGADPADALTEVPEGVPALRDVVVWRPDAPLQEREVEPATRRALEAAWTRSWHALQRAAAGDPSLLSTWFSGPALDQVGTFAAADSEPVELLLGRHDLQIEFYSDDGAIVGLRADPVRLVRVVAGPGGPVTRVTDDTYEVLFLLEDGNWRIRQWQRIATRSVEPGS